VYAKWIVANFTPISIDFAFMYIANIDSGDPAYTITYKYTAVMLIAYSSVVFIGQWL